MGIEVTRGAPGSARLAGPTDTTSSLRELVKRSLVEPLRGKETMRDHGCRFDHWVPETDWAEVLSHPGRHSLVVGHPKDVSEGGLSLQWPLCLLPGLRVHVKLSRMTSGELRYCEFGGTVVRVVTPSPGHMQGVKFSEVTPAQQTAVTDYLCQVEWRYYWRAS